MVSSYFLRRILETERCDSRCHWTIPTKFIHLMIPRSLVRSPPARPNSLARSWTPTPQKRSDFGHTPLVVATSILNSGMFNIPEGVVADAKIQVEGRCHCKPRSSLPSSSLPRSLWSGEWSASARRHHVPCTRPQGNGFVTVYW